MKKRFPCAAAAAMIFSAMAPAAGVCVNPWITSDARIYSDYPAPNTFSMEAFHESPAFKGLSPKEFCRRLFDIYYDGRRKNWSAFKKGLTLWAHTPQEPRNRFGIELDPVVLLNVHGSGYCGIQSGLLEGIYQSRPGGKPGKPAIDARRWFLAGIVHSVCDAFYDGRWHYYDIDLGGWAGDPEKDVWSVADVIKDPKGYYGNKTPLRSKYFFRADGDGKWVEQIDASKSYAFKDNLMVGHEMTFFLRRHERFVRYFSAAAAGWTEFAPFTKRLQKDQKGFCELVWEPGPEDLSANALQEKDGFQIFDIRCPYNITSSKVDAGSPAYVSFDIGRTWKPLEQDGSVPDVGNRWDYLLKVPSGTLRKVTTRGMLHPGALPRVGTGPTRMKVARMAPYRTLTFLPGVKGSRVSVRVPAPPGCKIVGIGATVIGNTGTAPEPNNWLELHLGRPGGTRLVERSTDVSWWGKNPDSPVEHGQTNVNGSLDMEPSEEAEVKVVPHGWGTVNWMRIYVHYVPDNQPPEEGELVVTHGFDGKAFTRTLKIDELKEGSVSYVIPSGARENEFVAMEVK